MRAGPLRKKITIQSFAEAANAYGEPVKTWATHAANRWARIEHLSGSEGVEGQQVNARMMVKFVLRYTAGVRPKMRVVYGGENYDIESVANVDERNRELHLVCLKVNA